MSVSFIPEPTQPLFAYFDNCSIINKAQLQLCLVMQLQVRYAGAEVLGLAKQLATMNQGQLICIYGKDA